MIGSVLQGTYRVEDLIGTGGMAYVYKATHLRLGGDVAIKILFSNLARDETKRGRFLREARIQHQLNHPNIVRVQDIIKQGSLSGFVMEWCNGGTLLHMLQKAGGPLSMLQLSNLFPSMVDALGYAHQNDVIHRDLKPQNILLHVAGDSIQPKITDFGIAKTVGELGLTRTGEVMGTLEYASPEQLKDSKSVDIRSDIYSLGVLLYRMATGRLPFTGSPARLIKQVLHKEPPAPIEAPSSLHPLIMRCLEINPSDRYSSCHELRDAFFAAGDIRYSSDSLRVIIPTHIKTEDLFTDTGAGYKTEDFGGESEKQLDSSSCEIEELGSPTDPEPLKHFRASDTMEKRSSAQWWTSALLVGITLALVALLFLFYLRH